jgi:CubicO group peptidase (beta-lactamase class C family)
MNDTGFSYPPGSINWVTTSYRHDEDGVHTTVDGPDGQWASEPAFASGAGGLMSTAADLLAFQRMLLSGGGDVLPRELVAAMMTDQLTPAIRATDTVSLDGQTWDTAAAATSCWLGPWSMCHRCWDESPLRCR